MPRRNSIIPTNNCVYQTLNEWVEKCRLINFDSNESVENYLKNYHDFDELINCIIFALENEHFYEKYLEDICRYVFKLYRIKKKNLRLLAFNCLPSLIGIHLIKSIHNQKLVFIKNDFEKLNKNTKSFDSKNLFDKPNHNFFNCVDALLLSIYNLEVLDSNGNPKIKTFKVPVMSRPSIYHESSLIFNQDLNQNQTTINLFGPYQEYENITASNRINILTVLLEIYNENLTNLQIESLISLCNLSINLLENKPLEANQNMEYLKKMKNLQNNSFENNFTINFLLNLNNFCFNSRRCFLNSKFLIQLLTSVYFCLFNGVIELGKLSLKLIHECALELMYFDVLLMTNSLLNSTKNITNLMNNEDQMGINVVLSPNFKIQANKTAITNASFKTQIMSEDIPIVTKQTGDKK